MSTSQPFTTTVLQLGPSRFDMGGRSLPKFLSETDQSISPGLAKRLIAYASSAMEDSGFLSAVAGWSINVYTMDADERPADRSYCVRWTNAQGGALEVIGILTSKGWPSLNHGIAVGD
ncbi:TPA: hypothetical protein NIB55_005490 [Pseudomonas aeruginosa]|nr:hypothetical protein [Pseudomonas aeruginosa]